MSEKRLLLETKIILFLLSSWPALKVFAVMVVRVKIFETVELNLFPNAF